MQQLAQKRGKVGLRDTGSELPGRPSDALQRVEHVTEQIEHVVGAPIRERALRQRPHALVGIQLGRVRGEVLDVQAPMAAAERAERLAVVDGGVVEQDDHVPTQVAQQVAEEGADLPVPDVVEVEVEVKAEPLPDGAHRDAGDRRDLVAAVAVAMDRGLAARSPRLQNVGDQEEARFVREDEVGAQPRGFFFTRGHRVRFQRSIAASSRSTARRSGFWWLQPSWRIKRPTWSGW